ncbi:MAG: hypothetical protein GY865_12290, partial [candidate division Zixibacteria bacterium]|nr:hypothetical protein [candidate division Zixibacteria bacterium]
VGYSSKINSDKRKGITFDSTIYLSIEMVDKAPELIWMVYPNLVKTGSANLSSVQVTLNILVDYSGKAIEVAISGETMIDQNTIQTVLESARTSLFKPAQKNNQSVKCWVQVPMEFEIDA